jgi:hypothetical protein
VSGYVVGPILEVGESPFPVCWESDERKDTCEHVWENVVVRQRYGRFEECVRCMFCHVPRCGFSSDRVPCMERRHHHSPHRYLSGRTEKVGV